LSQVIETRQQYVFVVGFIRGDDFRGRRRRLGWRSGRPQNRYWDRRLILSSIIKASITDHFGSLTHDFIEFIPALYS
jgi:hypothetical protein